MPRCNCGRAQFVSHKMSGSEESDMSTSEESEFSDDQDYPWQDEVAEDGGIFYVEEMSNDDIEEERSEISASPLTGNQSTKPKKEIPKSHLTSSKDFVPTKTVFVSVDPPTSYDTRFSSILREMLGIISFENEASRNMSSQLGGRSIVVSALVPDGPTMATDLVDIGDILLAINNVAVNHSNVEQVLDRVPHKMELQLTLMCEKYHPSSKRLKNGDQQQDESLGSNLPLFSNISKSGIENGAAVLYLTLNVDSESAREEEDILYLFPRDVNVGKFKSTRGVFSTLADISVDAFGSDIISSAMIIDEKVSYCMYHRCGQEVLIICTPPSLKILPIHNGLITSIVKLLKLIYNNLSRAFEAKNWRHLDHIFNFYLSCLTDTGSPPGGLETVSLNDALTRDIDCSLTEYEASDFDDGFHNPALNRKIFSIVGTCLFYKDTLITSHVSLTHVNDFYAFCQCHKLFNVSDGGRILIWREVYPNKEPVAPNPNVFKEADGRYFYLLIGLRGFVLCVLLKCRSHSSSPRWKPEPPTIYINHGTAVILNLESLGILQKLKNFLQQTASVTSPERFAKKGKLLENAPIVSRFLSSSGNISPQKPILKSILTRSGLSLYYMQYPDFSGVVVRNLDDTSTTSHKVLMESLVKNFNRTAAIFHNRWKSLEYQNSNMNTYEEGSLFVLKDPAKPNIEGISYWVVGRYIRSSYPREFYVCYPDTECQDVVELAFKMGFSFHDNVIA